MERRRFLLRGLSGLALLQIPRAEGAWGTLPVPPAVGTSEQAPESYVLCSGRLNASAVEQNEGYFTVGGGLTITVRPLSTPWYRLRELLDRPVEIVVRPIVPREPKRISR